MNVMKKFYCYVASLLVAAIAMIGCTEDLTTDNDLSYKGSNNLEYIEVTADLENEESRATLTDDGNGGHVVWSNGDTIGAITSDGTITECAATSIDGSSATFSVPSNTVYAVYPYLSDDTYDTATKQLSRKLVSDITLDGSNMVFDNKENVMVAQLADGNLSFKHLCGFIEVKLKGTGTVKHIALRSNARHWEALSGLAYINLGTIPDFQYSFDTGYKLAFNWIYATCSNVELSASEAKSFYFVVPPRTYENMSICVQTDKGSYAITAKNAIQVNRAKIRPIAAIDLDTFAPTSATDMSVNGIANCYIVPEGSEAKYYSFPAQKLNATQKLAKAAYAHVLWSDRKQLITNVHYDPATGTVSLKYAGGNAEGNAMVSVFDASHNALWTWHIWCTDQPQVVKIKNAVNTYDKYHGLMDRNLGATYAPKTLDEAANISTKDATDAMGLYYQYGRPIPFPKATSITNTTAESAAFGANSDYEVMYGFKYNLQSLIFTVAGNAFNTMMSYPNIYGVVDFTTNKGTTVGSSTDGNRYHAFSKGFPMPCIQGAQIWYSENADVVKVKGNTDPCPPGYCIDEFDTFKSALYNIPHNRISQGDPTSNKTYGYTYQCPTTKDLVYIPATGYRTDKGVYSSVGLLTNLWSMRNCTYNWLYGIRWYTGNTTDATVPIKTTGVNTLGWGFNVRCRVQDRTSLQTPTPEPEYKHSISILFVGNSLTQDGIAYLPYILKNYYPDVDFKIYMWYIGGKTMGNHYSTFTSLGVADIFSVAENSEKWTNFNKSMKMETVLATYKFDIVCMQEYFNYKTSYEDCTDWENCKNYIVNNYMGGNELKFMSLFHAPLRKEGYDVHEVYERTKAGNALILKNTISEDIIPCGIAVYNALRTDLNTLGDLGQLSPDGTHTQEGLPCLLQTYVALEWLFDKLGMDESVKGHPLRMTTDIYNKIAVPGANLGTGVVQGTEEQYSLAQDIAIQAFEEGKQFLKDNLE